MRRRTRRRLRRVVLLAGAGGLLLALAGAVLLTRGAQPSAPPAAPTTARPSATPTVPAIFVRPTSPPTSTPAPPTATATPNMSATPTPNLGATAAAIGNATATAIGNGTATASAPTAAPEPCTFRLGFKTLHDLIPEQVGDCTGNEHPDASGNTVQTTTRGLLIYRGDRGWTEFTNGERTWINGPCGLAERGSDEQPLPFERGEPCAPPEATD
jgi:hypothetical protein